MIVLLKKKTTVDDIGRQALFAVYPSDSDKLNKIPEMQQCVFVEKKNVNGEKHGLIFALARFVKDYLPEGHEYREADERTIIALIQVENGCADIVENKHGVNVAIPWSISFSTPELDRIQDLVIDAMMLASSVVSKIPIDELRRDYKKILGGYR